MKLESLKEITENKTATATILESSSSGNDSSHVIAPKPANQVQLSKLSYSEQSNKMLVTDEKIMESKLIDSAEFMKSSQPQVPDKSKLTTKKPKNQSPYEFVL